ncbi:MAG: hypothetical protein AAGJ32_11020 [Pseudomonadota bacterium]
MRSKSLRSLPKPVVAPRNGSRSRAQMASEMTRLEFERERLVRDADMMRAKLATTEQAISRVDARLVALQDMLLLDPSGD